MTSNEMFFRYWTWLVFYWNFTFCFPHFWWI